MNLKDSFKIALNGLKFHKRRSALTILGIVIGISAIIIVMSIGQSAKELILNRIQSIGANIVVIKPGRQPKGLVDVPQTILSNSLKDKDVKALEKKNNVPDLKSISPAVLVPGNVSYRGETYNQVLIIGWVGDQMRDMFNIYPLKGQFFTQEDIKRKAMVAVIGEKVKKELFGSTDALGKKIKIKNKKFKVVGVLPAKGQVFIFNIDDLVLIPYSTAQKYLLGIDYYYEILVEGQNEKVVPRMVEDIKRTIRESHRITNPAKDDFFVVTQTDMAERVGSITGILIALLVSVAAISLLVGGVGIMNIMLVSVTERTHEIGLRKAVGASNKDIMTQFLFESILLTIIGGLIGIILGAGLSYLISIILARIMTTGWIFSFSFLAAFLGCGMAAFIGLVFGIYPAHKAADLNPIEALRYE